MGNSIEKKINCQVTWQDCRPNRRCNNYKKCPHCAKIYRKREFSKSTCTLTEKNISKYQHKYYIVFTCSQLEMTVNEKQFYIDNFMTSFFRKKRNKSFPLELNSEMFCTKEISYKNGLGYNPHANLLLLQFNEFDFNNKNFLKLCELNSIKFHFQKLEKDKKGYINSIHKIINYSLKFEESRSHLERDVDFTKFKRKVLKTSLFSSTKKQILAQRLYNQIAVRKSVINQKINLARKTFKRNINKNNKKQYLRLLKSYLKKCKFLNLQKERLDRRYKAKIKSLKLKFP